MKKASSIAASVLVAGFVAVGAFTAAAPAAYADTDTATTTPAIHSGGFAAPQFYCKGAHLAVSDEACAYVWKNMPEVRQSILSIWRHFTFGS